MFKEIIMPPMQFLFKNFIYTSRNGLAKGLKRKGGLGFVTQLTDLTKKKLF